MGQPKLKRQEPPSTSIAAGGTVGRYLTRAEAADLLGCSSTTILNWERRGRITPHWAVAPGVDGVLRNSPLLKIEDVLKLPRRDPNPTPENPDELCARAFVLFENGKTVRHAVIELRASYEKLLAIHAQWLDSGGCVLEISETAKSRFEKAVGGFSTVEELADLVDKIVATTKATAP